MESRLLLTVFLLLVILLPFSAGAAMYAYVDARGICHYTNTPGDGRYKLRNSPPRRLGSPEDTLLRTIADRSRSNPLVRSAMAPAYLLRTAPPMAPQSLNGHIQSAAMRHQVDPLLIKAVIQAESNFDANAVSPKGAQGLMQLMPGTARDLLVTDPLDPRQNINGGTKYLRYLLDNYNGNVELSLAAYNAGPGNVTFGMIPNFPETQSYVAKVLQTYRAYRNAGGYSMVGLGGRGGRDVNPSINVRQVVTIN